MEGETVTVLAPERDETFTLTSEDEAALVAAMAEGDRGDVVSVDEFFRYLERAIEPPSACSTGPAGGS